MGADRWCIARTSAAQTLRLAETLAAAGVVAWTPRRTVKRPAPGARRRYVTGQRRVMIEVTHPIMPGIVFVRGDFLDDLVAIAALTFGPHPAFSILQLGPRAAAVRDHQLQGLRSAEADADAAIAVEREAETREAARLERAERFRTERARLKALRRERKHLPPAMAVTVAHMPALEGLEGRIVSSDGTKAVVNFGGAVDWVIEAWRLMPVTAVAA